jgi:hypothetical protein
MTSQKIIARKLIASDEFTNLKSQFVISSWGGFCSYPRTVDTSGTKKEAPHRL